MCVMNIWSASTICVVLDIRNENCYPTITKNIVVNCTNLCKVDVDAMPTLCSFECSSPLFSSMVVVDNFQHGCGAHHNAASDSQYISFQSAQVEANDIFLQWKLRPVPWCVCTHVIWEAYSILQQPNTLDTAGCRGVVARQLLWPRSNNCLFLS